MTSKSGSKPHVLILGAGLGGLTLAQSLRKKGISYDVFERDRNSQDRLQGWAIALHTILDDFYASMPDDMPPFEQVNHLRPLSLLAEIAYYKEGDDQKYGGGDDGTGRFIRANRSILRQWLSHNLDIHYDKKGVSIDENADGVTLHFRDGSTATGDIVVGADGVHSIIREHLLGESDPIRRHKAATISGELDFEGADFAEQLALGHSSYVVDFENEGLRHHLFVGLNGVAPDGKSGHYYWHLIWHTDEGVRDDHWTFTQGREEQCAHAQNVTRGMEPHFRKVVERTKPEQIKLPAIHYHTLIIDELRAGRATLLGDAAHAMPPFRGEGGCQAMWDALNLARAVESMEKVDHESIKAAMKPYQEEMLQRGGRAAKLSSAGIDSEMDTSTRVVGGAPIARLPKETIVL